MAKAYGEAWEKARKEARPTVENKQDAQGNEHDDGNGQFTEKAGGSSGAPSETTEKTTHTPEQQKRIEEYQASVDQSVVDFVEKCKGIEDGDELSQMKCPICDATPELGARVKELTGLDTTGWKIELRGERARLRLPAANGQTGAGRFDGHPRPQDRYLLPGGGGDRDGRRPGKGGLPPP